MLRGGGNVRIRGKFVWLIILLTIANFGLCVSHAERNFLFLVYGIQLSAYTGHSRSRPAPTVGDEYIQSSYAVKQIHFSYCVSCSRCSKYPRVLIDTHVLSCLQPPEEIQTEGRSWRNPQWVPSVQGECEDCLCKLCLSLLPADNNRVTIVAVCPLELPPNTSRHANTSCVYSSTVLLKIGAGNFSLI